MNFDGCALTVGDECMFRIHYPSGQRQRLPCPPKNSEPTRSLNDSQTQRTAPVRDSLSLQTTPKPSEPMISFDSPPYDCHSQRTGDLPCSVAPPNSSLNSCIEVLTSTSGPVTPCISGKVSEVSKGSRLGKGATNQSKTPGMRRATKGESSRRTAERVDRWLQDCVVPQETVFNELEMSAREPMSGTGATTIGYSEASHATVCLLSVTSVLRSVVLCGLPAIDIPQAFCDLLCFVDYRQ